MFDRRPKTRQIWGFVTFGCIQFPRSEGGVVATKNVIVHYRKVLEGSRAALGVPLHRAMKKALEHAPAKVRLRDDWNLRTEAVGGGDMRFLNNYEDARGHGFGTFLLFEENAHQALLSGMGRVADVSVAQLQPEPGRQFLKGILYWLVVGDHLFCVQSSALRVQALEQHVAWLLSTAQVLGSGDTFELVTSFNRPDIAGDLDIRHVAVHGRILSPARAAEEAEIVEVETESTRSVTSQRARPVSKKRAREILRAIFPDGSRADQLYDQIPEDGELDFNFDLMLKTKDIEARRRFHRELQRDLRNADDGQVRAVGPDGKMSGEDIRLQAVMPVEVVGSLLDLADTRRQLLRVYNRFLEDGKIDSED